jgi:hypothetical protein
MQTNIVFDGSGSIYSLGGGKTNKCSANGILLWNSSGGVGLAVDSVGNAYVIGNDGKWWVTTKYSSSGAEIWTARYWDGSEVYTGDSYSGPTDIAVDASGNVYVTGKSTYKVCSGGLSGIDHGPYVYAEYTTIKYSQR